MEKDLEEYLQVLNSERCLKKPKEAKMVMDKIHWCLRNCKSQLMLKLLINLIMDENGALFSFIWKTCSDFELISSATSALKLIECLLEDFKEAMEPYFCKIFHKCLLLVETKFARVKEFSLRILKGLISADRWLRLDLSKVTVKLKKHLKEESKISGTVSEQLFSIVGLLLEKYPESLERDGNCFFLQAIETLWREMNVIKNPSLSKIKGALEAINGYLINFPVSGSDALRKIYGFIKRLGVLQAEKRAASRLALKIFQNHWKHFSDLAYEDRDHWKNVLSVWLRQSSEDRRCGFHSLTAFYRMVTLEIKKGGSNEKFVSSYFFEFARTLKSKESNVFEKRSALLGVKLFVLTDCLKYEKLSEAYQLVEDMQNLDSINIAYLPVCIECASAFALKLSESADEQLSWLQRMSVLLIDQYPKIEAEFQHDALLSLEKSFYTLAQSNLNAFETHVEGVLYQGLIRSCSYLTVLDAEVLKEVEDQREENFITHKSYLTLWKYLLNLTTTTIPPTNGCFILKKGVAVKVFDGYVSSFLKIISKLNYELKTGPEVEEVEKPSDLRIFANCVELYVDLMPVIDPYNLQKWIIKILQSVIHKSYKNPLVAGFYKILSATLRVADMLDFFGEAKEDSKQLVSVFLERVLLKVNQYKEDLQLACLETLLAAPVCLIETFAEKTIPALEMGIRLGRGNFQLLKNMIETLERWNRHLSTTTANIIMRRTLPHFHIFFQSSYFPIEAGGFNDSELLMVQKRFLLFLGSIEIGTALTLVELPEGAEEERRVTDKKILYRLPFGDQSCQINLDDLLPRVMELARSCSDRSTRITACELLYSMVIVILGNINQVNGSFTATFRKIMRCCLILGCDSDCLVFQIFEPLMFQIIHFFSMRKAAHFTETQDLMDILIEYVSIPYDPAARDFAALLMREFTLWTIKQIPPKDIQLASDSLNKVLNNIYSLSLHPNHDKRLGAAIIFNKIYPILREEDFIFNAHWFQLFYHFLECLRMCDELEDVTEVFFAIQHIKRPLMEKSEEFNEASPNRIVPPEFSGGQLCHLVKWTFDLCWDSRTLTRRTAMSLAEELAPLVSDCNSLPAFIRLHLSNKSFRIRLALEKKENDSVKLNRLIAIFDYYTWLINQGVITVEDAFGFKFNETSKKFLISISSSAEVGFPLDSLKRQGALSFLSYLFALRDKAYFFRTHVWEFLKICVFKPSDYGFDMNDAATTESLSSLLIDLLKFFSIKLTHYEWDQFFEELEWIITVPNLKHITKSRCLHTNHLEFLHGINTVQNSGMWSVFKERLLFIVDGWLFVGKIFDSLFFKKGRNSYAISPEPSCKAYLEGFLKFAFKISSSFENIFSFVENSEIVREEETGKCVRKGEYFLLQFKNVIFEFINTRGRELIERIFNNPRGAEVNLLVEILLKQRAEDGGTDLGREVLNNWFHFVELKTKKIISEKILLRLAVITSEVMGKSECLNSCPLSEWVYSTLKNETFVEMNVDKVEGIFTILSFLADFGENGPDNEDLKTALDIFFGNPSALREFEETESCQRNRATVAVKGLLRSLKHTGSLIILQVIVRLVKFLEKLAKEEEVVSALSVFTESGIPSSRPLSALKLLCDFCFEKRMFPAMRIVRDWFINPLLEKLPNRVIYDFVTENLECLCSLISSKFEIDDMLKLKTDVAKKICASNILKIFIFKMTNEELDGLPKEKRQCIDRLIKSSYDLIPDLRNDVLLLKRVRSFVCELFNLICSIICARCSDHKIYKLFIFDERGCFLYGAIDIDVEYGLDMDFVEIPKRKKYLTSLRKSVTLERQMSLSKPLQSVKYIQTNTLFSSSLLEDVTKFDLTLSPIRPISFVEGLCPPEPSANMTVELESDVFNNHECMATLVGVIHKMMKNKIFPSSGDELPCWLTFFLKVLTEEKQHKNLKLFILKAIYNVQEYVKPYCEKTFPIVLDSICSLFGDSSINYLFVDFIAMLVEWRHIPTCEKSRRQLTQVASIFMSKSDSFRRDIVKSNMETFKMIIEVWKDALFVRDLFCLLLKRLSGSIEKDIENDFSGSDGVTYVNIQVVGILLSNDVLWPQESSKDFFDLILKGIREKNKNKERFAEVCGLALDRINRGRNEDVKEYERQVRDKIACQPQSRLSLLYAVHKYYPKMVSKFIFDIYASTWNFVDSVSVKNLEMLLSYVSDEENSEDDTLYRNIASFLRDMMKTSDISVHEISLQIANKILGRVEEGKVDMIVGEALKLSRSSHPGVRKWVYEIAKKYYSKENYRLNIGNECKFTLLRGLTDEVKELEDFCVDFWQTFLKCSTPYSKLLQVLRKMYAVETESDFLNIAVRILLNSSSLDSYSQSVFPNPITHETSYQKRNLLDVRKTSLSGFVSAKSWTNQSLECVASLKSQSHLDLRPKKSSLNFAPTVSENAGVVQKMNLLESDAFEEERTVKNPLRRRFFKSLEKTNFSIKRQQIEKKKHIEEDIEMIEKKKTEVEVLGDYKAGDYPDVQIAHYQILKPLQVLAKKDHQIARQFLTSFYSGLFEFLNEEDKQTLLSETNKCFNNIFKSSSVFDPALFGFVFQILLEHSENLDIDCEEFSRAAIASNQLSLGVLAMERIISNKEEVETEAGKRRKLMKNSKDRRWLELAKLYRSLEESDVLSGIFLDKLKIYGAEKEALRCEIFGNWMEATKHYEVALKMESDSVRSEFYTESYFSCLAKLSDWTALNQCIRISLNQNLSKIWDSCYVLPWFVKSEMMISLTSGDNRFQMILEDFYKEEGKKKFLSANFIEELTVCDMLSGQLERASCKIDRLCLDFLLEWSHLTQWSYKLRATKLTALQTISELYYVVKTLNEKVTSLVEKDVEEGMRRWEKNMPSTLDDLMTWDVKLKYRERLVSEINDINLHKHVAKSKLALAKAALSQDNLHLAREYLIPFRDKLPELEEDLKFEYKFCLNLGKLILARSKVNNIGIKAYVDMWKILLDNVSKAIETDSDRSRVHLFRCNIILGKLVSEMLPQLSNKMTSEVLDSLRSLLELSNTSEDITRDLTSKGLEYFETGKDYLEGLEGFASDQANSYLELSKYILNFSYINTYSEFEKLTLYLLKSMKLGSAEARDLFGCILNKSPPVEGETAFESLLTECDLVPSWMFLAWISQILASLTSILFPFLKVIVFRIAEEYPNAIRYPFRLSKQSQGSSNPELASLNRKLTEILSSRVYEGFLNSMNYLGSPDLILKHHLENVLRYFEEDNPNYSQAILDLVNLHEFMYSPAFEGYRGPVFKYWNSFKDAIESLMVLEKEKDLWKGAIENLMASLETSRPVSKRMLSVLKSYSPWLNKFHSFKMDESLEVPGQYMGRGKPILKYMATISSFKNEVLLFNSKCKPIRITITGNDAVEHKFLVKFGEDLRQDERIQQVFRHFNGKLKESKGTRRFSLDVYSVVPLSFTLGMIQWVDNNVSLREMVESSLGVEAAAIGKAQAEHLSVLAQSLPVNGPVAAHLIAYEKISRDVAVAKYNQRVRSFPGDLLKKAFWAMSNSPEHFFHLRTNFATSYASMSVTHWLVGIGDRHLDNTLVSTKTGRVLGVDFGYAFGFATQCLTPPELVPFRLTPQILNLVHPLDESGWIKQTMVHCLRRFRRDHFVLLSVLEVFAVEPVMDWLHQAKKSQRSNADRFEEPRPRQQITLVQRKLGGANPVSVFEMDLKTGHSRSKYLPYYLEVLRGTLNTRTSFGETGLTEEEQVECLIDLATDHHVLSKTYVGWNPWL